MGNITGTPFLPEVTDQINKRQEFLGENPKQDKHIIWQNNKSAFLRLASSVNIEDEVPRNDTSTTGSIEIPLITAEQILTDRNLPKSLTGDLLAKSSILFAGVSSIQTNPLDTTSHIPYFPQGVGDPFNQNNIFTSAYGWGGLQQGYRPMPGIEGADITYYNRGALQKATINCKVFSIEQLQVFDLLYFRIGYTMLLEWGHNIYIDNKGNLKNRAEYFTDPINLFFGYTKTQSQEKNSNQNEILTAIKSERSKSAYNYDAMLGKITNFSWKFNSDGSYDITLTLIGMGDVIESMKINSSINIEGAPQSPSQVLTDKGNKIAAQQTASENSFTAKQNELDSASTGASGDLEKQSKESAKNQEDYQKLYNSIPEYNKLSFFATQPTTEEEYNILNQKWITFKNRASVKKISQSNLDSEDGKFVLNKKNYEISSEVPPDSNQYPSQYIESDAFGIFTNPEYKNYVTKYLNIGETGYDGGKVSVFQAQPNQRISITIYGLLESSGNKYNALLELAGHYKDQVKKQETTQKLIDDKTKSREALDKQKEAADKAFRDATRVVEAGKEREEIAPQAAKESASKTKLNAILWGWIDALNKDKNFNGIDSKDENTKNFCRLEYRAKSMNSGETGVSEHGFTQYYVRLGHLLDWITGNLLFYDITPIQQTTTSGAPSVGSQDFANLNKTQQENIVKAKAEAEKLKNTKSNNPNPKTTQKQPTPTQKQTKNFLDNLPPLPPNASPMFTIDTGVNNRCLNFPTQISSDPFVCLIPMSCKDEKGNGWSFFINDIPGPNLSDYFVKGNSFQGNVMNIRVNIDFCAKVLANNVDTNGKVNLLKYLNDLCNNINDTLGNVNKLQAIYSAEENTVQIIDDNILKRGNIEEPNVAVFKSFGVNIGTGGTGEGSFLRNVDFQVQLPPNMAAMATISAQASGNIVGENFTGLSKLNSGLNDRIIRYKLDPATLSAKVKGQSDSPEVIFQQSMLKMYSILKETYLDLSYQKDNIDTLRSINRDISLYVVGDSAEKEIQPSPFFIPFDLSLEMDGLSGMVNYQRFAVEEKIFPYSYRPTIKAAGLRTDGKVDFLIKGISHSIKNNVWTTKLNSLTVSSKGHRTQENVNSPLNLDLSFLGNKAQQIKPKK
jgi:hypothetical protein